jgi:site-specific DNA-methyltransferase (adenine-specific)
MPEQLLGRIIRACSNPREIVLDPFGGSGTTLAVAKKLDRRYLSFELSAEYTEQIRMRLDGINIGDPLDGAPEPTVSAPSTEDGVRLEERLAGKVKSRSKPRAVETNQQTLPGI